MRLRSVLFVAVAILLLPAQTLAGLCWDLTSEGTSLGVIQFEIGPAIGPQFLLPGQFLNTAAFCGAAEAAEASGSGALVAAGIRLGFQTTGTESCFPVTVELILAPAAPFGGIFHLDMPSTATFMTGTATPVGCFAYQ